MLRNKTEKAVEIKYNSIVVVVEPNGSVDVRDFRVPSNPVLINACEKHICKKNPGVFDVFTSEQQTELKKETFDKINALESEIEGLKKQLDAANKAKEVAQKEALKYSNELTGALEQIKGLKEDVKNVKAKLKAAQ